MQYVESLPDSEQRSARSKGYLRAALQNPDFGPPTSRACSLLITRRCALIFAEQKPSYSSSFRFAGDDLWGDGYARVQGAPKQTEV